MKNNISAFLFILLLIAARQAVANQFSELQGNSDEKVILFTDRSIYIVGEKVHFSATLSGGNELEAENISRILYCELITPDGKIITNNKYLISNSKAAGCISIPVELLTGTYYLKAYTKLMRQNGPQSYEYKQIRIVNPHRPDVLSSENNQNQLLSQFVYSREKEDEQLLAVSVEKQVYLPRDTINLSYTKIPDDNRKITSMCLSVVPENTKSLTLIKSAEGQATQAGETYFPETRGLSLAGKLTEASSQAPVIDKRVNLSIIGEGRDFMAVRTDSEGRFFFALPDYTGSRDIFLCAEKTPAQTIKIWVDNDFCTSPFRLPSPVFSLNEQERKVVQNMAQNVQINSVYQKKIQIDSLNTLRDTISFYGKPTTILYIDKYVQLPTLEEYFNELPSQVKVRKRKGEPYFAIQGIGNMSFYDPLVLVDWVAVDEPAKVLAASPQNISRIEVVNEDYVKGGQTYGGIVSIISRKGDFAGIDLPSTGIFINYRFLADEHCSSNATDPVATHPDTRNTVFWKPELIAQPGSLIKNVSTPVQSMKPAKTEQENQRGNFVFTAPDTPGRYLVVFEGITSNGETFAATSLFEVKN